MKTKVFVTGAGGQLGNQLLCLQRDNLLIKGKKKNELDITDELACLQVVKEVVPDIIIHTAAFTKVDLAEHEKENAWNVNVIGTQNMVKAAQAVNAKFCYISTDYVFNGKVLTDYDEFSKPDPLSVYGKTKLAGEEVTLKYALTFNVRTSWLYGSYGPNFVHTILTYGQHKTKMFVVEDQVGTPTYTLDLANRLLDLVQTDGYGTYHITNSGHCSWYTFAKEILRLSGYTDIALLPCTTKQSGRVADRPLRAILRNNALITAGFPPLRPWQAALAHFLQRKKGSSSIDWNKVFRLS